MSEPMSDFFSHLIAKNLDGTETLRPRPPGLFEPTKGGGGSLSHTPIISEPAAEFFVAEVTSPDRLEDTETLDMEVHQRETTAPVTDDRSSMADQPLDQFTPARMNHVVGVKRREDPETRIDWNQAAPASSGANAPHGNLESALERITRPFDPTRDSPALSEQRVTRLPEPISRRSEAEEQLAPKNAPQITLKPRTSPAAERKDDEAVTPQIPGEPVRQLARKSATKFIVVEEARPISTRQLNRSLSEQGSEATAARNSAALLDFGLRRNDDGRPTIAEPMPVASVQSNLAPVQPARVSSPAVARPQVTRYVEGRMQFPEDHTRGTPATKPTPTIQVTIGRIEVRATPPPAQHTKKQNSAPPVMTLDEYLGNRGKGKGR